MKKDKKMNKNKTMKWAARALALCLVGTMAFAGAGMLAPVTAEAAPTIDGEEISGSLTVSKKDDKGNALAGATFAVYKVMSLTPGTTPGSYASYTVENAFSSALSGVTPDALGNYSAAELEEKIQDLKSVVDEDSVRATDTQTTATGTGNAVFSNLDLGYYLVVETDEPDGYVTGSPFLIAIPSTNNYNSTSAAAGTEWVYNVTAEPKNTPVSIGKELAVEETGAEQDGSVKVGDYVKYQITTTIPDYPAEYTNAVFTITDVMSAGLDIQNDTTHPVVVTVDDDIVNAEIDTYTLTATPVSGDNADLTVAFTSAYIKNHGGESVVVTYYALVKESAVTGTPGNPNDASVTYNNRPDSTTTADAPVVTVYSFNIQVVKFTDEEEKQALSGAVFELYGDPDMSIPIEAALTTASNGQLTFDRLDEGTYYLKETQSPEGYTLLADPIKVEIIADKDNDGHATGEFTLKINDQEVSTTEGTYVSHKESSTGTAVVAVENHKGFSLPSTGGSGIALFLIIGAAGIITLSVVITKKTKKNS